MKNLVGNVVALYVRFVFRGKHVILVCGMRRSGNHALIQWLANSLEGKESAFRKDPDFWPLKFSESGNTIFINEINMFPVKDYFRMLLRRRRKIHGCKTVIISAEDVPSGYKNYRIPEPSLKVYARRSLLNLIASRLHNLKKHAADGLGWSRQNVDLLFFNRILSWKDTSGYTVWNYDQWINSPRYRQDFLQLLGLRKDLLPPITAEGGGSSFTGDTRTPFPGEALNRYRQVEFSPWILEHVRKERFQELLTPEERAFVHEQTAVSTL